MIIIEKTASKMRQISILLFVLFFTNQLSAQSSNGPANSIKFGFGTAFLQPAGYFGRNTMHAQYELRLFKPVSIALNGFRVNAEQIDSDDFEKTTKAYQADAGLNIALFSNETNALKIGGGASWQTSEYRYTTSIERDSNDQIVNRFFEESNTESYGWMANLEYEVYIIDHIVLGSRLTYKQYENGDKNYFFGLNAGFRF
jgi:hypothetical protein